MEINQGIQKLKQDWLAISGQWGASTEAQLQAFNLLLECYTASNRHYHGISHIQYMLQLFCELQQYSQNKEAFFFAIWFHDSVQQSGKDDEELSAALAKQQLQSLKVPDAIINQVCTLILATKNHKEQADPEIALFIDIDLAILAASRDNYQNYAKGCKKEYAVPDFIYRRGRKHFFNKLLRRDFIFSSQLFRDTKESSARENIKWEIDIL